MRKTMTMQEIIKNGEKVLANTYARFPVAFERGEGVWLYDLDGKKYLDFLSGISVNNIGHCHPKVVEAIRKQAGMLLHTSNLYHIPQQTELAMKLVKHSFADRAFFCNSGAEANEAAIKLARKWGHNHGRGGEVITTENSFHGRTLATITATGQPKYQKGFEPLPAGFPKVGYGDAEAVRKAITDQTAAVLVEPIQAEGGVNVPYAGYLRELGEVCKSAGVLLIYDEVQTGMGRTGSLFAYEHESAPPDIMTLAKGLGGGVPIGCMLAREEAASMFDPGSHAATFGGNPLSCAAGNAAFDVITAEGFLEDVRERADYLREVLSSVASKIPGIKDIRGRGMLMGIGIEGEAGPIVKKALEKGLLIGSAGPNVLRFAPPLIITRSDMDFMASILEEICSSI